MDVVGAQRCAHASRPALPHRRTYAAMILSMDRAFEKTAGALRTEGMLDNTLVAFMSDNGGVKRHGSSNAPFRGEKGVYFEGARACRSTRPAAYLCAP